MELFTFDLICFVSSFLINILALIKFWSIINEGRSDKSKRQIAKRDRERGEKVETFRN